jgi:hypothetical protein
LNLFVGMFAAQVQPNIITYSALLDCKEFHAGSGQSRGGHIFQHGLLPLLKGSWVFQDLKVDLHNHSEGAARIVLQWWLSTTVLQHLEKNERVAGCCFKRLCYFLSQVY